MSKSMNMLRQHRRDNNIKPNRRLDRKSSRGMIYENEELRLKTININAEIERGQSDIKKLRRENEMLKKEIWCLRDEYEKLDKLLKDKDVDFSSSTCTSDSDSCSSCTEESEEVETSQNLENVQKTNLKNLHVEFDHLSVVPEENSTENSDKNSTNASLPPNEEKDVIKPDQSYPALPTVRPAPVHFFAPLPKAEAEYYAEDYFKPTFQNHQTEMVPLSKAASDVIVKLDNQNFATSSGSFSNGGNLEELLNDIETISQDILKISSPDVNAAEVNGVEQARVPYKSELNVVLMPTPMPLLGFEKYENLKASRESLTRPRPIEPDSYYIGDQFPPLPYIALTPEPPDPSAIGFRYKEPLKVEDFLTETPQMTKREDNCSSRSNLLDVTSSDHVSSENEENLRFNASSTSEGNDQKAKSPKLSIRRKVSIHFKGKKDKKRAEKKEDEKIELKPPQIEHDTKLLHRKTPSIESKKSLEDLISKEKKRFSLEAKSSGSERNSQNVDKKAAARKSVSVSPERKHVHHKDHKKHKKSEKLRQRRSTISTDRAHRERSFSVCTDRSNILDHKGAPFTDDYLTSDRERTNSLSSCGTIRMRKMSNISNFPAAGKIPWCGCWGNGCI